MTADDKYTYPGSGGVLVNAYSIRDATALDALINDFVSLRLADIDGVAGPTPDFASLQRIHRAMFADVVPAIAGRVRDVDVGAVGTGIAYCRPDFVESNLSDLFARLDHEDYLRGFESRDFANALAERWGFLTQIHPFRDGNTRSQSVWVSRLALRAGFEIDWRRVDVPTLRDLRVRAMLGREKFLADYLLNSLRPVDRRRPVDGRAVVDRIKNRAQGGPGGPGSVSSGPRRGPRR